MCVKLKYKINNNENNPLFASQVSFISFKMIHTLKILLSYMCSVPRILHPVLTPYKGKFF